MTANNNISTNGQRSILQHCMFGVLFVLIIMNWDFYRVPSYESFQESINRSEKIPLDNINSKLDYARRSSRENANIVLNQQQVIIALTDRLLLKINDYDSELKNRDNVESCTKKTAEFELILKDVQNYLDSIALYFDWSESDLFMQQLAISKRRISQYYKFDSNLNQPIKPKFNYSTLSILNQCLKLDILGTQELIIEKLTGKLFGCDLIVYKDPFHAVVIPNNYLFFSGGQINAGYFMGYKTNNPYNKIFRQQWNVEVNIGSIGTNSTPDGYFIWRGVANHLGANNVKGKIRVAYFDDTITRSFSFSYFVAAPGAALVINKNNFCYLDMPNLMRIKVPGYAADKIKLRVAGATVRKIEDAVFDIRFSKIPNKKVYAFVDATNEQGRTSTVHSIELKVIAAPPPITNLDAFKNEGIDISVFKNVQNITAFASDTDFEMDYEVLSFEVECISSTNKYTEPISCVGAAFATNPQLQSLLQSASPGDLYILSHIIAKAANGKLYEALPVSVVLR